MELKAADDCEDQCSSHSVHDHPWPLADVEPKKAKFPCCIIWTPLPIVSWLAPYMGHVGICLEDGRVVDFSGSNFVGVDNFAYGAATRYLQLDRAQFFVECTFHRSRHQYYPRSLFLVWPVLLLHPGLSADIYALSICVDWLTQACYQHIGLPCCFPPNLSTHTCKQSYRHTERGTAISWDDALHSSMQRFHHKNYNLFTCNCHSFVANCLNLLAYNGSVRWNVLSVAALILWRGRWVDGMSVVRSFLPFVAVSFVGILMAGWPFIIGLVVFFFLLLGWFIIGIYCLKTL